MTALSEDTALLAALDPADQTRTGRVKAFWDARIGITTASPPAVSTWADVRTTANGSSNLVNGVTPAQRPTLIGANGDQAAEVSFTVDQFLQHATGQAALAFGAATGYWLVSIGTYSNDGPACGVVRDPLVLTAPYHVLSAAGGVLTTDYNPGGGLVHLPTTVARSSTVRRLQIAERMDLRTGVGGFNATNSGDVMTKHHVGGHTALSRNGGGAETTGNNFFVVGRLGTVYGECKIRCMIFGTGELTAADRAAIAAYAVASHDVTLDEVSAFLGDGNSHVWGANDSGVQLADPPIVFARTVVSGARGSLITQGFDANVLDNHGISGRTWAHMATMYPTHIAPWYDPLRAKNVLVALEDTNSLNSGGRTALQAEQDIIAYCTLAAATGWRIVLGTCIDRGTFYTGTVAVPTGVSVIGQAALDLNSLKRSNWRTYPGVVGLVDFAANNAFAINRTGTGTGSMACSDLTYYDSGAALHMSNVGSRLMGTLIKTALDADDGILYPVAASTTAITTLFRQRLNATRGRR